MSICRSITRSSGSAALGLSLLMLMLMLTVSAAHAQGTYIYHDGYASTGGCNGISDHPPSLFLQDAGPVMRDRHHVTALARDASGNVSHHAGSLKLGKIYPFRARARVNRHSDCSQDQAQAYTNFTFIDKIAVTAGSFPVGTPVTYTATVDLPVRLVGDGPRCPINSEFVANLYLNDQQVEWRTNGPYQGTGQLVLSVTTAVGQQLRIGLGTRGLVSAVQYSVSDNYCASNEVALIDPVRMVLSADTVGANTTSINGVRYGVKP